MEFKILFLLENYSWSMLPPVDGALPVLFSLKGFTSLHQSDQFFVIEHVIGGKHAMYNVETL